jgi:hypothetical protein
LALSLLLRYVLDVKLCWVTFLRKQNTAAPAAAAAAAAAAQGCQLVRNPLNLQQAAAYRVEGTVVDGLTLHLQEPYELH